MSSTLYKIRKQRLDKVEKLKKLGINPYPAKSKKSYDNKYIVDNFKKLEGNVMWVTGRIMALREHGLLKFISLQDFKGNIQLIIKKDDTKNFDKKEQLLGWNELELIDIGDFIQAEGKLSKSNTGEISIKVEKFKLLTKAIRPLPEKWKGIKDKETKFRRRYLDFITNTKSRELFVRKSLFWQANRDFMKKNEFIELNTPILEHVTGGADANPFVTHHDALDQDFYMRISPELYLKRLIGGGFEKVFTIGACFRNEGIDDEHLQEYYTNEWYWAYADYRKNMELVQKLYRYVAKTVYKKTKFKKENYEFDLSDEWKEIDYVKILKEKLGIDIFNDKKDKMLKVIKKNGVELDKKGMNKFRLVDNLWKIVRKGIAGPAYLINEPKFMSPLAKSKKENSKITERFHVILAGSEVGNGYSELNDPLDQYNRFKQQQDAREAGDKEAQMMDIDFVEMLEYGMPPTTGFGVSERLFWFLEGVSAREGTLFPQTRYHIEDTTKEIYGIKNRNSSKSNIEKKDNKIISCNETDEINPGITRKKALELVQKYTKNKNLVKHMLSSEAAMREYARYFVKRGKLHEANIETWAITGLLHDIMYEKDPKKHMYSGAEMLKKEGVSEYITHAIEVHGNFNGTDQDTLLDKVLWIAEECTGLVVAATLVLPSKKLNDLKIESLMKRWNEKRFTANINRENIKNGIERIGLTVEEHLEIVLNAMKKIDKELGL